MSSFQLTNEGSQPNKIHEGRIFPDEGNDDVITCMTLTQEFLIYGTEVSVCDSSDGQGII